MISKPLDKIDKVDIDNLIIQAVPERRTTEYKQALPNFKDEKSKWDFFADVSSFANASGGDLFYGIVDSRDANNQPTGLPEKAPGLADIKENPGAAILTLENSIRANISPRIPGLQTRPVSGFSEGPVIVMHIPKSFVAPHMVVRNEWGRFYSRNSQGKQPLDIREIRSAFALSETHPEKVRRFRAERISEIVSGSLVPMNNNPKVVLHVVPYSHFDANSRSIDLRKFRWETNNIVNPLGSSLPSMRFNLDGVFYFKQEKGHEPIRYRTWLQLFRSGAVETVTNRLFVLENNAPRHFYISNVEKDVIDGLGQYLKVLRDNDVPAPVVIMLTLLQVKDFTFMVNREEKDRFDRDMVFLPEVLVEDFQERPETLLRPVFDALWQSCGCSHAESYDGQGDYIGIPWAER